jgi:hypothetical protein
VNFSPTIRVVMSAMPPAPKGTKMRTARFG